jgi:lipoprotein-anchoring transpeptidase ErfK/SrfK
MKARWITVGAAAAAAAAPAPALAADEIVGPTRADGATTARIAGPAEISGPTRAEGATTAQIVAATHARARPGAGRRVARLGTLTDWSGHAQQLLVLRGNRDWVKVLLPTRPNGSAGWVPRDKVLLGRSRYWIKLRLSTRRLTVFRDGKAVRRFRAVIGAPGTPTPSGPAAIYERNRQPNPGGFLGPWSLSLTAHSNVLESFGGGPGRVAIHGREGASLRDPLGSARSHGCVRIDSGAVSWLAARVRPGTPVEIARD